MVTCCHLLAVNFQSSLSFHFFQHFICIYTVYIYEGCNLTVHGQFQMEVIIPIPLEWGLWIEQGTCVSLGAFDFNTCLTQSEQLNPYPSSRNDSSIFIWPSNSSTLYSNCILSNLSSFYLKKHKHLTLYQLHTYSLTASFSCKTNTRFLFSIFYILVFLKKKTPSYVYSVRLTRTCNSTCMLLLFCWFWLLL